MVTNAGILRDTVLWKMSDQDFDTVVDVHLRGTFTCARAAIARFREQGDGGRLVLVGSPAGQRASFGQTNYSAAKAGIVGLSKAAAKEMAHHGVRVNVIQPGLIRSAMTEALPQHIWDQKVSEIALQRVGEPRDIARVALFLASEMSSYMTGTVLEVSGGRFM
jgi:3-oxoacyl-[acyl-carrier protein] reductase